MKIISIGRNPGNSIVISDNMISRRHAVIRIYPFGKYEIISSGSNGTKVNGNQIVPNQPYPLKRGDSVTFANVANLDWKQVPNPLRPYQLGAFSLIMLAIIVGGCIVIPQLISIHHNWNGSARDINTGSNEITYDSIKQGNKIDVLPNVESSLKLQDLPDFKFKENIKKNKKEKQKKNDNESRIKDESSKTPSETSIPQEDNISSRY